ncbi:unnamed protein product, partial [Adineta steineri]
MDTYGKDDKRLPYYLKWADAVLITYSIIQQDSFEMALAYLDAINSYSKSLTVSNNELVIMLIGNKLDLERTRVVPKSEGESIAAKFSCAFCETTAADDYEYVQQLFHRTVREVRKERERAVASNCIDEEPLPSTTMNINTNTNIPSSASSSSSTSSSHFLPLNDTDKISSSNIPLPPPMPATLIHQAARAAKTAKPESQNSSNSNNINPPFSPTIKSGSLSSIATVTGLPPTSSSSTAKRAPS